MYYIYGNFEVVVVAARLTDKQKKKIVADYLELGSYRATGKKNGVSTDTVKRVVLADDDIVKKTKEKKEQNTADIMAYMESKRDIVCQILDKGLNALNDPEKLKDASPAQITTALGTLIDKWALITGRGPADTMQEDELSKSLKELAEGLESDD